MGARSLQSCDNQNEVRDQNELRLEEKKIESSFARARFFPDLTSSKKNPNGPINMQQQGIKKPRSIPRAGSCLGFNSSYSRSEMLMMLSGVGRGPLWNVALTPGGN